MEGGSHYGRMNGETPNVPITTLAGIASLTDLLPELPVPGPSTAGPLNAGSNLLYHSNIVEQASHILSNCNEITTQQILHALTNTPTDYVELNDKNLTALSHNNGARQPVVPPCNLSNALYHRNSTLFENSRNVNQSGQGIGAHDGASWDEQRFTQDSHSAGNSLSNNSGYNQQGNSYTNNHPIGAAGDSGVSGRNALNPNMGKDGYNNGTDSNSSNITNNLLGNEQNDNDNDAKGLRGFRKGNTQQNFSPNNGSIPETKNNDANTGTNGTHFSYIENEKATRSSLASNAIKEENDTEHRNETECKIPVSKLSKEEIDLMEESVKTFKNENPKQAEELGITDSLSKRKTRATSQSKNTSSFNTNNKSHDGLTMNNVGGSDGNSDDEDDSVGKSKRNKFFKASESQRIDEFERKRKTDNSDGSEHFGKRRRQKSPTPEKEEPQSFVPKKVTRKIEQKLRPMLAKIDAEELMDSNMYVRFNKTVDLIFENMEDVNMQEFEEAERNAKDDGSSELPPEILIPKYQLQDLASETAKLKSLGAMESIPNDKLVKLLNILELNIRDGSKVVPLPTGGEEDDEDEDKMWLELAMERVTRAADSSLTVLHVLTSKNMAKNVYIEDVIDRVVLFLRFQLSNTIYPSYDPVYKEISKKGAGYMGNMKKKRNYAATVRDKNIIGLYSKCRELTDLLADLVKMTILTDTTVLHISTIGVAPFFVESIQELQLSALKLVRNVFGKYEKHRKLLLDDILASIARLPSSKRSLRTYRLDQDNHIQMLTALVLQLIQCVVTLPKRLALEEKDKGKDVDKEKVEQPIMEAGNDDLQYDMQAHEFINSRMHEANGTAYEFLTVFLKKCGSKNEDIDYRPLFENFVQDLLTTVNTPEWPAAELLLSFLGRVLRDKFCDRSTEMALRISSLEYLGVVAARLRKDAVESKMKVDYIDSIINIIKEEEEKEKQEDEDPIKEHFRKQEEKKKSKKKNGKDKKKEEKIKQEQNDEMESDKERQRSIFLQRVLLDYLAVSAGEEDDISILNARHFYIAQWYRDANADLNRKDGPRKTPKKKKKRKSRITDSSEEESDSSDLDEDEDNDKVAIANGEEPSDPLKAELFRLCEKHKKILLEKILPFGANRGQKTAVLSTHIDHSSAQLIVRYLSSKRPFANSFNQYLTDILKVLGEQSTHVRTKALKCVTLIVQEDPDVLMRADMQNAVQAAFLDQSTMAREAAIDLVGKFILHKQELITQYYDIITARILDTGVSVRKRVIKILKDICLEFPGYERIPDICVRMIRRINDEEGIRKLVMEVFQNMWFIPVKSGQYGPTEEDSELLVTRARNITDVVIASRDTGLEWFEQLLQTVFKPKEDKDDATKKAVESNPQLVLACQQIVDCLVESVLRMEESNSDMTPNDLDNSKSAPSLRVSACLTTLFLFSKTRPQLLVGHVQTLQPYLSISCKTQSDYRIVSDVARTLELTVPLIKHPSEIFLAQLEEDAVKLILQHDKKVVSACLSCLGSVVNEVTKNFKLIQDCFDNYFTKITVKYKKLHEANSKDPRLLERGNMVTFRRALFTVGLLLRHFDFSSKELYEGLQKGEKTVEYVFSTMFYFMRHTSRDIQSESLNALGFVCVRHYNFMLEYKLKNLYIDILSKDFYPTQHKTQVLCNIELYLQEEDIRMIKHDKNWKEYAKKENLKEMGDVSSGMASTVIQVYLKCILDSFVHPSMQARHATLKVIQLILAQGLVHPVQIVPYLICMATDIEQRISHTADRELQDIEKKYPGFIHMKLLQGIKLSYTLQEIVQIGPRKKACVRGSRNKEGELPTALNGFLYSILKNTKAQRRGILTSLLKQFEEHAKSSLPFMLYLADNLAYIPFTVVDEPLFVIHHIDIMISVSGSNLLQTFKEKLKPPASCEARTNLETGKTEYIYDEDLDDDEDSVFDRLPDNVKDIQEAITCSQGCLLLLVLREHLKDFYGFTTARINEYSPTDVSKANERAVNRRNNVRFNPKATIDLLSQGEPPEDLDDDQRRELVQKYMEFKELMNKMDPDEEEEDEDGNPIKRDRRNHDTPIGRVNSNSNKNTQIQSSTPSPSKPTPHTQQNIHSVPMYNNIPQQPITPIPQTNPNQHMQYNPEYYQYQQQQMILLEEQNRRLAAETFPQHMVAYPQGNVVNNHQPQHHGNIPRVPDGMVLDPMTGELVPAGGMRHF